MLATSVFLAPKAPRLKGLDMTIVWIKRGAVAPCGIETVSYFRLPRNGRRRKAVRILLERTGGVVLSSQLPRANHLEFAKASF